MLLKAQATLAVKGWCYLPFNRKGQWRCVENRHGCMKLSEYILYIPILILIPRKTLQRQSFFIPLSLWSSQSAVSNVSAAPAGRQQPMQAAQFEFSVQFRLSQNTLFNGVIAICKSLVLSQQGMRGRNWKLCQFNKNWPICCLKCNNILDCRLSWHWATAFYQDLFLRGKAGRQDKVLEGLVLCEKACTQLGPASCTTSGGSKTYWKLRRRLTQLSPFVLCAEECGLSWFNSSWQWSNTQLLIQSTFSSGRGREPAKSDLWLYVRTV